MKTNRIFFLLLSLLTIGCAPTAVAEVIATVDRTSIVLDETLTLTITKDGSSFFSDPDLDLLQKDFKVLGQSQQSSTQIINGAATSTVVWKITLSPRHPGKLEIPPLPVGKEKTNSLAVKVIAEAQAKTSSDNASIFIETDVDEQSVFVQAQVIYTLRIYWAIDAQIMEPDEPEIADAFVKKLDDATFEKVIDGKTYRVFERKYALFPQKSGVLEIPQMVLQVNIPSRQNRLNRFDPFGMKGERLKLRSESEKVTVREKPQEYPASALWLPSAGLSIKADWSQNPQDLKVSESATLSLSIIADGLMAEQLPPVELVEPDGVKVYQGKAEVENLIISTGIIGKRKESIALIPTHSGELLLPEIRIPWWNKLQQKVEYAVIPAEKLQVQGVVKMTPPSPPETPRQNNTMVAPGSQPVQPQEKQGASTLLIILCAVFAVAWLITLYLLLYTRRQMEKFSRGQGKNAKKEGAMKEREAFHSLVNACKTNDPGKARATLLSWAILFWPDEKIQTYTDIIRLVPDSELSHMLHEMDSFLYGQKTTGTEWHGERLLDRIKKIRNDRKKKKKDKEEGLQKLYK